MSFDPTALARIKARETGHPEPEWFRALENARSSLGVVTSDGAALEPIVLACRSPAKLTVMTRLIYQHARSHPHGSRLPAELLESVNGSSYALADWIDAIDVFHSWLVANQRKIDFRPMLKYLECCAAAPEAKAGGPTLVGLVEDMLRIHGYVG